MIKAGNAEPRKWTHKTQEVGAIFVQFTFQLQTFHKKAAAFWGDVVGPVAAQKQVEVKRSRVVNFRNFVHLGVLAINHSTELSPWNKVRFSDSSLFRLERISSDHQDLICGSSQLRDLPPSFNHVLYFFSACTHPQFIEQQNPITK